MPADRFTLTRDLFERASALPPKEQAAFLADWCRGDNALLQAVERLLAASRDANPEWDQPAVEIEAKQWVRDMPGAFGPYRAVECLGAGGMSVVYKAVRTTGDFEQTVAIKVLPGGFETRDRVERFRRERQILASLTHPNIARLLDGGATSDGLPYLVMEFVEGEALDRHAAGLSVEQRLRLFLPVCDAVQHAHRNLVVHCDIKPANILVERDGTPKLLDFGISKLLDEMKRTRTATSPLMSIEYASPEQVLGQPIGTASDIYSLGVLLFVLLTARRPYGDSVESPPGLARAVCEQRLDPVGARLPVDLANIIALATMKEAASRYGSVQELGDDIRRYLTGHPVAARPAAVLYRARKFAVRNRLSLAIATVAALAVGGVTVSRISEARLAEKRFHDIRGLAHELLFGIYDEIGQLPGSTAVKRDVIEKAQKYLITLESDAGSDLSLTRELAASYIRLGDVMGSPYHANLGDTAGALRSYRRAVGILERALKTTNDRDLVAQYCLARMSEGRILMREGDAEAAETVHRAALGRARKLLAAAPDDLSLRLLVSRGEMLVAEAMGQRAERNPSVEGFRHVYDWSLSSLATIEPVKGKSEEFTYRLAAWYAHISYPLWDAGYLTQDPEYFRKGLEYQLKANALMRQLAAEHPGNGVYIRSVADSDKELGWARWKTGDYDGAMADYLAAMRAFQSVVDADPANKEAQRDVADAYDFAARTSQEAGKSADATKWNRKALEIYEALQRADPQNADYARNIEQAKSRN